MSDFKQAALPLWGNAASARTVNIIALGHFKELCDEFVAADEARDEGRMSELVETMREVVSRIGKFQRAQFRKWAKEREANRK